MVPSVAVAAPLAPTGLLGLDIASLVERVIRGLVDLAIPDFGSEWATAFVSWLASMPDVTEAQHFPALARLHDDIVGAGFGVLGASFVAAGLALCFGYRAGAATDLMRRAVIGAGALVFSSELLGRLVDAVNLLTGEMVRSPVVVDGLDAALGGAVVLAAATSGLSLGLAVVAALGSLYFIAALIVMKVGDTTMLAVLHLTGGLVWGLYVLPGAEWLARAWTSGVLAALLVPVAWALLFSGAAVLSSDALTWTATTPGSPGAPGWLDQLVKPFVAATAFWLAYKAPSFLLAGVRVMGISPAAMLAPRPLTLPNHQATPAPRHAGGPIRGNVDRFHALIGNPRTASTRSAGGQRHRVGVTASQHARHQSSTTAAAAIRRAAGRRVVVPAPVAAAVEAHRRIKGKSAPGPTRSGQAQRHRSTRAPSAERMRPSSPKDQPPSEARDPQVRRTPTSQSARPSSVGVPPPGPSRSSTESSSTSTTQHRVRTPPSPPGVSSASSRSQATGRPSRAEVTKAKRPPKRSEPPRPQPPPVSRSERSDGARRRPPKGSP